MQTIRVSGKVTQEVKQTMKKLGLKSAEEKKQGQETRAFGVKKLSKQITTPKIAIQKQIIVPNVIAPKQITTPRTLNSSKLLKPSSTFLQKKNSIQVPIQVTKEIPKEIIKLEPKKKITVKPRIPKLSINTDLDLAPPM